MHTLVYQHWFTVINQENRLLDKEILTFKILLWQYANLYLWILRIPSMETKTFSHVTSMSYNLQQTMETNCDLPVTVSNNVDLFQLNATA